MDNLGYRVLLVPLILAVNAFFSAAEAALLSSRKSRLQQRADDGESGAHAALSLLENPERLLSVGQFGLTLASLALGAVGESAVESWVHGIAAPLGAHVPEQAIVIASVVVAYLLISFLHVVIGEVVPKNLAIETSDRMAVLMAPPLLFFYRVVGPFVSVIERAAAWISRLLGIRGGGEGAIHSMEELRFMIVASRRHQLIDEFEEHALNRLLDLRETAAREIMTPRNRFVSAPVESTLDDVLRIIAENKYSRLPVYENGPDNVIGLVYAKDLIEVWQQRRTARDRRRPVPRFDLRRLLRQTLVIPETAKLDQLIGTFRHGPSHLAVVVDEFGAVTGLITLEDVLEEVFGEIDDEHDARPARLPSEWEEAEIEGSTTIIDLEKDYGIKLPPNAGFETLAGYLMFRTGSIPAEGDAVTGEGFRFTVSKRVRNRIDLVRAERVEPEPQAAGQQSASA